MNPYLLFHLHGPLQSWGGVAVGEVRGDEGCPTKSGVLGLVAAALKIPREDDSAHAQLHSKLNMAVRVLHPGLMMRDYHTSQVPSTSKKSVWITRADELAEPGLNTILSTREYRADAVYAVALWERAFYDLEALVEAFARPGFHLYLGRKSCAASLPIKPEIIEAPSLQQAFRQFPAPPILSNHLKDQDQRRVYFEGENSGLEILNRSSRRDRLTSRSRWIFEDRKQYHGLMPEEKTP